MLKKLVMVGVAAIVFPMAVQAEGAYVGVGLGQSNMKADSIPGFTTLSQDENDTAYKLFGGYEFSKNFGAELGYTDFGKLKATYRYNLNGVQVNATGDAYAVYAALTGTLPLDENFALNGKLGIATNHISANASVPGFAAITDSGNRTSAVFGVGILYQVTKTIAIGLEYENYGEVDEDVKADAITASIRFSF